MTDDVKDTAVPAPEEAPVENGTSVIDKLKASAPFQGLLLGGFAIAATATLLFGFDATSKDIALRAQEDLTANLTQVIPHKYFDNDLLAAPLHMKSPSGDDLTIYRGSKAGQITAVAYQSIGYGYGGAIKVIMAVDPAGEILGVRVLSHAETPGLGDKIEANRSDWVFKFNGRSFGNTSQEQWAVKKDGGIFDQFSGATITPRAVVKAVKEGLRFFADNKTTLLAPQSPETGS